jgi:hypothetical protein
MEECTDACWFTRTKLAKLIAYFVGGSARTDHHGSMLAQFDKARKISLLTSRPRSSGSKILRLRIPKLAKIALDQLYTRTCRARDIRPTTCSTQAGADPMSRKTKWGAAQCLLSQQACRRTRHRGRQFATCRFVCLQVALRCASERAPHGLYHFAGVGEASWFGLRTQSSI